MYGQNAKKAQAKKTEAIVDVSESEALGANSDKNERWGTKNVPYPCFVSLSVIDDILGVLVVVAMSVVW